MAGQAALAIRDKRWNVYIANVPWELEQGLGGIPDVPSGFGMLFDLGLEQYITVTTEPMLFPLDIAFLSEGLEVIEVYRSVQPGYQVTSTLPARYFLEVNAHEISFAVFAANGAAMLAGSFVNERCSVLDAIIVCCRPSGTVRNFQITLEHFFSLLYVAITLTFSPIGSLIPFENIGNVVRSEQDYGVFEPFRHDNDGQIDPVARPEYSLVRIGNAIHRKNRQEPLAVKRRQCLSTVGGETECSGERC